MTTTQRVLLLFFLLNLPAVTAGQPLRARLKSLEGPEMGSVLCYELRFGAHIYCLVPPRGWSNRAKPETATIRFEDLKRACNIEVLFSAGSPSNAVAHPESTLRDALKNCELRDRFPVYAAAGEGVGADVAGWLHGALLCARTAVIPLKSGYVTFILTSAADQFPASEQILGALLTSFQELEATDAPP